MDMNTAIFLAFFQYVDILQPRAAPFQPSEEVLEQLLDILHRWGQVGIVKGQGHEQVGLGEIGVEQTAELGFCVPLVEPLLDLGGRLFPLPSPLGLGVCWEYLHLQILPTVVFPLSVCSLHFLPSLVVVVLIPYTRPPYGRKTHPVGKCFVSNIEAEIMTFSELANIVVEQPVDGRVAI
jgi:hypothetical protein